MTRGLTAIPLPGSAPWPPRPAGRTPGDRGMGEAGRPGGGLQAVMFDMDGLLVDSEPLWFEAEAAIMDRMGSPWGRPTSSTSSAARWPGRRAYMHAKAAQSVPREVIGLWLVQGMADLIRARGVQVMPGALELLAEVAAAGLPHALVTSAEPEIMAAALDSIGVRFPVTVCAADVARGKPDPEPYLRAAALLGVSPRAERRAGGLTHRHHVRARRGLHGGGGAQRAAASRAGPADRPVAARGRSRHPAGGRRGAGAGRPMTVPL